jgi:type I restriction enzyme S subunit
MTLPRYPTYKDSGVEWLGQVPEHWQPKKLGAISSLKGRLGWQGLKADEYRDEGPYVVSSAHFDNHRVQWAECPRVSRERYDTDDNIQLAVDDLLLMKDGAAMGKLAFVESLPGLACLNSHLLLFRPVKIDGVPTYSPRFAFYFMQTSYFQEHIKVHGTGATFLGVSQATIGRYQVILPSLPEQTAIASFLDHETAKIDALVAEQERLVELLKEKRQSLISHAVTKGTNPKAPMKDSRIDWLGAVPSSWEVVGLTKYLTSVVDYRGRTPTKVTEGIFLVTARNIRDGSVNYSISEEYIDPREYESTMRRGKPEVGDVLFTTEAPLGQVANVDRTDVALAQRVIKFRGQSGVLNNYFLKYWMMGSFSQADMERLATGSTALGIKGSKVVQLRLCLPPINEQAQIVEYIDAGLSRLDALTGEAQQAIDLLQERRTALISAAVTGQVDVREAAGRAA